MPKDIRAFFGGSNGAGKATATTSSDTTSPFFSTDAEHAHMKSTVVDASSFFGDTASGSKKFHRSEKTAVHAVPASSLPPKPVSSEPVMRNVKKGKGKAAAAVVELSDDEFGDDAALMELDPAMLDASQYDSASTTAAVSQAMSTSPVKAASPVKEVSPVKKASPAKAASPAKEVSPAKATSPVLENTPPLNATTSAPASSSKKRRAVVEISSSDDDDDAVADAPRATKPVKTVEPPAKKQASTPQKKRAATSLAKSKTTTPKQRTAATEDTVLSPSKKPKKELSPEQKKIYSDFKRREPPQALGTRELPRGAPDALQGMTFVITGELDTLTREEIQDFLKRHGGRVTTSPSGKTSYVIVGREPGPKKLELIAKHGLKTLDEDGLYNLVKPAGPSKAEQPQAPAAVSAPVNVMPASATSSATPLTQPQKHVPLAPSGPNVVPEQGRRSMGSDLWTTKYAPSSTKEIIGNKSLVDSMTRWLVGWDDNRRNGFKGSGRKDDTASFRACLVSGPPGIGKTTSVNLVAKELGFDVLELNASDARTKSSLDDTIKELIGNHSIAEYMRSDKTQKKSKKHLIIMDEVDGMGAGDRGGMAELILLIKKTKTPIICICNDRQSQKVRSLANYCLDLRFHRPTAQQIRARIMSIAFKEGFKIEANAIDQLVATAHADIRQILNLLQQWSVTQTSMSYDQSKTLGEASQKNVDLGPFDLANRLFNQGTFRSMSLADKMDLYFNDYQLLPAFVQENYIRCDPRVLSSSQGMSRNHELSRKMDMMAQASDAVSRGDLVEAKIFGEQAFSLMPTHSIFSCVLPVTYTQGNLVGRIMFPSILGHMSKTNKCYRLLKEFHIHMRLQVSGDKNEIRQNYLPALIPRLTRPLIVQGTDGVAPVMETMDKYYITKEDWDALLELGIGELDGDTLLKQIPSSVKSAFTRAYNKAEHHLPYAVAGKTSGKKRGGGGGNGGGEFLGSVDFEEAIVDDVVDNGDEDDGAGEDDDEDVKAMLKPKTAAGKKRGASSAASSSKQPAKKKAAVTKKK